MSYRIGDEWVTELRGMQGVEKQRQALEDLGRYLYKVVYNYILKRQSDLVILQGWLPEEHASLAQDLMQETLLKFCAANFNLLDQFHGYGQFTSWAAKVAINEARQEFRKSYWQKRLPMPTLHDPDTGEKISDGENNINLSKKGDDPAHIVVDRQLQKDIGRILQGCINDLPHQRRLAFQSCVIEEYSIREVAEQMGKTPNAVYQLIHYAKRTLRNCLKEADVEALISDLLDV